MGPKVDACGQASVWFNSAVENSLPSSLSVCAQNADLQWRMWRCLEEQSITNKSSGLFYWSAGCQLHQKSGSYSSYNWQPKSKKATSTTGFLKRALLVHPTKTSAWFTLLLKGRHTGGCSSEGKDVFQCISNLGEFVNLEASHPFQVSTPSIKEMPPPLQAVI